MFNRTPKSKIKIHISWKVALLTINFHIWKQKNRNLKFRSQPNLLFSNKHHNNYCYDNNTNTIRIENWLNFFSKSGLFATIYSRLNLDFHSRDVTKQIWKKQILRLKVQFVLLILLHYLNTYIHIKLAIMIIVFSESRDAR